MNPREIGNLYSTSLINNHFYFEGRDYRLVRQKLKKSSDSNYECYNEKLDGAHVVWESLEFDTAKITRFIKRRKVGESSRLSVQASLGPRNDYPQQVIYFSQTIYAKSSLPEYAHIPNEPQDITQLMFHSGENVAIYSTTQPSQFRIATGSKDIIDFGGIERVERFYSLFFLPNIGAYLGSGGHVTFGKYKVFPSDINPHIFSLLEITPDRINAQTFPYLTSCPFLFSAPTKVDFEGWKEALTSPEFEYIHLPFPISSK